MKKFLLFMVLLFILIPVFVSAATYYVSTSGSDTYQGTQAQPWKTIQKAAGTVTIGDTVYVNAGVYNERVSVRTSGNSGAMISFIANGTVELQGFTVNANYVRVNGFKVTATECSWGPTGVGIWIVGVGCIVENNYAYYSPRGGIMIYDGSSNCIVRNNKASRNGMVGIEVHGTNNLIENNEVWGSISNHKATGCQGDADGFRYFGTGHIFRGNYVHDIWYNDPENIGFSPHTDAFQTWADTGDHEAASNVLFEKNLIILPDFKDGNAEDCGWMLAQATNITIRNNIVRVHRGTESGGGGCSHINVLNNIFIGNLSYLTANWPVGINLQEAPYSTVKNNIVYNWPGQVIYLSGATLTGLDIGYNLVYNSDGSIPGGTHQAHDLWGVNPQFVNPVLLDYHLQASSPAIDAGAVVDVTDDYDKNSRPQGAGYDIGAYEYISGSPPQCTGTCKLSPCSSYTSCTSLTGTCSSGYCCSGTCITPEVPGDLNDDSKVDVQDLIIVANDFGKTTGFNNYKSDTNSDNIVDIYDVVYVASRFT